MIDGFSRRPADDGELWVADGFGPVAEELDLARRSCWEALIAAGQNRGRGRVAFVETAAGSVVFKQLRRGGLAGPLWGQRFASRRRLLDNLALPRAARASGVATPAPLAMLLVPAGPGLRRAWLAVSAVPGAVALSERILEATPSTAEWTRALAAVRKMHDAGLEHPDLNLGNLLLDREGEAWIIDLDGARRCASAVGDDLRIDGIRRIERSYHKICFLHGLDPDERLDWLRLYSGTDTALDARWASRRDRDDAALRRHRAGWRRSRL